MTLLEMKGPTGTTEHRLLAESADGILTVCLDFSTTFLSGEVSRESSESSSARKSVFPTGALTPLVGIMVDGVVATTMSMNAGVKKKDVDI